jgi:broad specificity phosphatase PhoE
VTRLILYRHGRTAWNVTGRVQGQLDVDLDDVGVAQTVQAAPGVAGFAPDVIISSDLRRAARTAEVVATLIGVTVTYDERLRERHYGPWQGLDHAQIEAGYPDEYARWGIVEPIGVPEIESVADLAKRMLAVMQDAIAAVGPDGTALLVTHGGAARAGCAALLGWSDDMLKTIGALGNCHYAELRIADERGWQLRAHNVG